MALEMPRVPAHLRRFVVEQDYGRYTAVDQAVWRFVMLQTHARLVGTAHPIYARGLQATGISVDRIPRIGEMNQRLAPFGWGAVCVDGFIPPRAFQEFQAEGLLPIAADIRSAENLAYTPAPDVIHEAAGHAPILPDPVYASYLRRIGRLGAEAFTVPEDHGVFLAIHALSEGKQDPVSQGADIARAESDLRRALAAAPEASEATMLSRLYWWTAEYGLVGDASDYKIYGAGLLSSLGESHSCRDPSVVKRPLEEGCMDVAYDITKPQPQLFVAASFDSLHDVLDRVERRLTRAHAGARGLAPAMRSRELSSVAFSSGGWVMGIVTEVGQPTGAEETGPAWLSLAGPVAFAWDGVINPRQQDVRQWLPGPNENLWVVLGNLSGGRALAVLTDAEVEELRSASTGRHVFDFANGAIVEGRRERSVRHADGRLMHIELADVRLSLPGREPVNLARYLLFAAGEVITARAGAIDPRYHPDTDFPSVRVPRAALHSVKERRLIALYESAEAASRGDQQSTLPEKFFGVHAELGRDHGDEWLLRWNMLETLLRTGQGSDLATLLAADLERLEVAFGHRQPIASGLRYLLP